jgi:hypothetical protein
MWQLINKQVGKCSSSDKTIELNTETGIVTSAKADRDVTCIFCKTVEEIIKITTLPILV